VLQVVRGAEGVLSVPLEDGGVYTIGTAAHCQVALPANPGVAAEHARLTVRGGRVRFHHVAEAGASLVNGKPTTWAVLEPGDEIRVGPYVCRYLVGDRPAPNMTLGVRESAPAVHATTSPSVPNGST
jgi:pSer/pThr/pTyr-binding forkhead associated (FHA) protein